MLRQLVCDMLRDSPHGILARRVGRDGLRVERFVTGRRGDTNYASAGSLGDHLSCAVLHCEHDSVNLHFLYISYFGSLKTRRHATYVDIYGGPKIGLRVLEERPIANDSRGGHTNFK
jgi:hypothetical protein